MDPKRFGPWKTVTLIGAALLIAALLVPTYAYPRMFTRFPDYGDEGYMLAALDGYSAGGALYDEVYTQYGPLYYQATSSVFRVSGAPVDPDHGRMFVLAVWMLSALIAGVAVGILARSVIAGLLAEMLAVMVLRVAVYEPMHPGPFLVLLLLSLVLAAVWVLPRFPRVGMTLIGGLTVSLLLTKVNVGSFALLSLFLALVIGDRRLRLLRWVRRSVVIAFVCSPVLLMAAKLGEAWILRYAVVVALGAGAFALAALRGERPSERLEGLRWLALGAAAVTGVSAALLLSRTSVHGAYQGIIAGPLHQADAYRFRLRLRSYAIPASALGLVMAFLWPKISAALATRRNGSAIAGFIRLGAGLAIWLSIAFAGGATPYATASMTIGLALCWIAALDPVEPCGPRERFARTFVVALAVLQTLHAYPVAGSQVAWSVVLFIPVGGLCIRDGLVLIRRHASTREGPGPVRLAWGPAFLLVAAAIASTFIPQTQDARAWYRAGVALPFPGASRVHAPAPQTESLEWVVGEIHSRCSTFVSLPGMNAFYFFSGTTPPTGFNATAWMFLFDAPTQQKIVDSLRGTEGLCALRNKRLEERWAIGRPVPQLPLVRYINEGFRTVAERDGFELMVRKDGR